MTQPTYPQNPAEWQTAIHNGLALSPSEAQTALLNSRFPYNQLNQWFATTFSAENGYSPQFVPALQRNIKGLVAWVYNDGAEPYWPGTDAD